MKEGCGAFKINVIFLHKKFCMAKINFCNADGNADAEMPMPRFPNGKS